MAKAVTGYFPTFKLKEDLSVNMHEGIYDARLRIDPFSDVDEIPATVTVANGRLSEINKPDGYHWLVLLERIDQETTEPQ